MKTSRLKFLIFSIPAATVMFPFSGAHAALRVTNSATVQNQIQANAMRNAMMQSATQSQVARTVTNANGETISVSNEEFDRCASIYPGGVFDWATQPRERNLGAGQHALHWLKCGRIKIRTAPLIRFWQTIMLLRVIQ